jgi:predicted nucleic acid-binding protein
MIQVVIDPGVLVSGLISSKESAPVTLIRLWKQGHFLLFVSPHLLAELDIDVCVSRKLYTRQQLKKKNPGVNAPCATSRQPSWPADHHVPLPKILPDVCDECRP